MYLLKRTFFILSLLTIVFMAAYGSAHAQEATPPSADAVNINITQVDTSKFPSVTLYISAIDENGEPVGINPSRLVIQENDNPIAIDQIEGSGSVGSLTTLLVIDISGSMNYNEKLKAAKAVAIDYINQMRENDQAGLMVFNTKVNYIQPVTGNRDTLIDAINNLEAGGDTAMYDALIAGTDALNSISGRKAIVALTDGLDNRSISKPEDVIQSIGQGGLSISTVGLGEPSQSKTDLYALDEKALQYLADNAGGRYDYANDEASLRTLYDLYQRGFQSEYAITYTSPATLRDGLNRALSVSLDNNGALTAAGQQVKYNPGGLVPEVSEPAPWSLFFILLGIFLVLLCLPFLFMRLTPGKAVSRKRARIKFKD
jgi:VWFA-related protein